jgi:hypothetical protein
LSIALPWQRSCSFHVNIYKNGQHAACNAPECTTSACLQKEDAKEAHWETHGSPESSKGRNGGAHLTYVSELLKLGTSGFVAGDSMTVADIALADLVSNYMRNFEQSIKKSYPELTTHCAMVLGSQRIAGYLSSGKQFDKVNNNGLG